MWRSPCPQWPVQSPWQEWGSAMASASHRMDEVFCCFFYCMREKLPIYKVQGCKDTSTSLRDGASKRCSWQDMWYSQVPLTDRHHLSIMALFSVDLTRWWPRQFYQSVRLTPRGNLLAITRGSVSENWGGGGGLLGFLIQGQWRLPRTRASSCQQVHGPRVLAILGEH